MHVVSNYIRGKKVGTEREREHHTRVKGNG